MLLMFLSLWRITARFIVAAHRKHGHAPYTDYGSRRRIAFITCGHHSPAQATVVASLMRDSSGYRVRSSAALILSASSLPSLVRTV
jgi:hypothetical protein